MPNARRKTRIRSFAPIAGRDARVLILGSMPGRRSLQARQYYAHRQNAFWGIVCGLLAVDPQAPYLQRKRALRMARIAIWDVLRSCTRTGSLDSAIDGGSEIANDFRAFLRKHPDVSHVFFNGAKAADSFRKHVLPGLDVHGLRYIRLPSTSPANASVAFERKREAWQVILKPAQRNRT